MESNIEVLENIYRQLGVDVIWYESHDDIPGLVEQIFGVKRIQIETTEELKQKGEEILKRIRAIESKAPKINPASMKLIDSVQYITYIQTYGNEYRSLVIECGDILQELSNRVDWTIPNNLLKMAKDLEKSIILMVMLIYLPNGTIA